MRRLETITGHITQKRNVQEYAAALRKCEGDLKEFINESNANPILVRLAWHDSGTYNKTISSWPQCGGANGSIRFEKELAHGANAGLAKAVNLLKPIKAKNPLISWADLIQLASAVAIEAAGGPKIPMRYGRIETETEDQCPPEGNLPGAAPPFADGAKDAPTHLRNIFYRMGFDDREIVALSGAHTIGRAFKERSGAVEEGYGPNAGTEFTRPTSIARFDKGPGVGMPGGRSWTKHWLTFDNEFFTQQRHPKLNWFPTDSALNEDPEFKKHFTRYANQATFFAEYALAHKKLSELGSVFEPAEGIYI
jgi:L-ascorbate peroxidase